jgi:aldehyde dehydrogenase (NAD+)
MSRKGRQFVEPTIFTMVDNSIRIAQEEVFAPVLALIAFEDEDHAIRVAHAVRYGLAAGVWTKDVGRLLCFCEKLRGGTVWINICRAVSNVSLQRL